MLAEAREKSNRGCGQIVGLVTHFSWPLNDEMRAWREGDVHQVVVTVRVGDERMDRTGKRRRLGVIGFG